MPKLGKVQIGIIGAGGFANTHMEHFRSMDNVEVVAFCRTNGEALQRMQEQWDVPLGFTSYKELVDKADVDAIDIITPTNSHREIALYAIAAGKHVLCEKPLALTAADARDMLDAADRANVIHSTNFNQRGNMAGGRLKRYLDRGYVGKINHASIEWRQSAYAEDKPSISSWRFRKEYGGGVVYELIHVFDMARFIGGEVKRIVAMMGSHMQNRKFPDAPDGLDIVVPDSSAYLLEWRESGYAVVLISFVSKGHEADGASSVQVKVSGRDGHIETDGRFGLRGVHGITRPLESLEPGLPYPQPYAKFVEAIIATDQSKIETSFEDGMKAAQLVDAAYESCERGEWIDIA